ncbi:MAG: Re/Si-specific NAD(P)(+) transhydrogenase subunit alpha [Longimicrobiales bacterium]|nr:Re/Si-specific NAD(P)(+) transhydrogenase subunit alpha [Longimicrobiales bacterium]
MKVAVLAEVHPGERRVALVPASVKDLLKAGAEVTVQSGAGIPASISDAEYVEAGATVAPDVAATLAGASVLLGVQPRPEGRGPGEVGSLPKGMVVISFMDPLGAPERAKALADAGLSAFSMELIPRTTRAQRMDALSSQANLAGYKAVLLAADHLPKVLPMFMTAAGTIRPGKALVLGAGVAGLQAIATAKRLGAKVEAFDVRPAVKEQVQSLGATFLETEGDVTAEGEGGYAKELSEEQHRKELELIAAHIHDADMVITTAQIPGKQAPLLITEEMVQSMRPGSVIVDMAASTGGNCALSVAGDTVERHGVTIIGPDNLPATVPVHASQLYARNVVTFLLEMVQDGQLVVDLENDVVGPSCLAHEGEVRNDRVRASLGLPPLAPPAPPEPTPESADASGE